MIPPKGEHRKEYFAECALRKFPISRDPPEGGTSERLMQCWAKSRLFPISRDPPEGGTFEQILPERPAITNLLFPISRDPPEGGTVTPELPDEKSPISFQFLGIPPKGEPLKRP